MARASPSPARRSPMGRLHLVELHRSEVDRKPSALPATAHCTGWRMTAAVWPLKSGVIGKYPCANEAHGAMSTPESADGSGWLLDTRQHGLDGSRLRSAPAHAGAVAASPEAPWRKTQDPGKFDDAWADCWQAPVRCVIRTRLSRFHVATVHSKCPSLLHGPA